MIDKTTIGGRLKLARKLLGLTKEEILEKYGINIHTYGSWERKKDDLTESAISQCLKIFNSEGLPLTKEWILNISPSNNSLSKNPIHAELIHTTSQIDNEINFFKSTNKESVVLRISGTDMMPLYQPDEYIGGIKRFGNEIIEEVDGKDCIVLTKQINGNIFRRVIQNHDGKVNLHILNPRSKNTQPIIYNVDLVWAAPVVWRRVFDDEYGY